MAAALLSRALLSFPVLHTETGAEMEDWITALVKAASPDTGRRTGAELAVHSCGVWNSVCFSASRQTSLASSARSLTGYSDVR